MERAKWWTKIDLMVQTYATKSKPSRFARHGKNLGSSEGEKGQGFGLLAKISSKAQISSK